MTTAVAPQHPDTPSTPDDAAQAMARTLAKLEEQRRKTPIIDALVASLAAMRPSAD